jgi:anti-anti-sigma factor
VNTAGVPDRLLLDYRLDSGVAVVKVTGEVDVSTSSSLRNSLLRVITAESHHGLVVNLASVSFLDSTPGHCQKRCGSGRADGLQ